MGNRDLPEMFASSQVSDALVELKATLGKAKLIAPAMAAIEDPSDEVITHRTVTRTRKLGGFDYEP